MLSPLSNLFSNRRNITLNAGTPLISLYRGSSTKYSAGTRHKSASRYVTVFHQALFASCFITSSALGPAYALMPAIHCWIKSKFFQNVTGKNDLNFEFERWSVRDNNPCKKPFTQQKPMDTISATSNHSQKLNRYLANVTPPIHHDKNKYNHPLMDLKRYRTTDLLVYIPACFIPCLPTYWLCACRAAQIHLHARTKQSPLHLPTYVSTDLRRI